MPAAVSNDFSSDFSGNACSSWFPLLIEYTETSSEKSTKEVANSAADIKSGRPFKVIRTRYKPSYYMPPLFRRG